MEKSTTAISLLGWRLMISSENCTHATKKRRILNKYRKQS